MQLGTEADSGRTFDLRVGDTILVALRGNRTTGFGWYPRHGAGDVQILAEKGDRYETGKSSGAPESAWQGGTHPLVPHPRTHESESPG